MVVVAKHCTKRKLELVDASVELVVSHSRCESIVSRSLDGWRRLQRMILRAVEVYCKGVEEFVFKMHLMISLSPLGLGECQVVMVATGMGVEGAS